MNSLMSEWMKGHATMNDHGMPDKVGGGIRIRTFRAHRKYCHRGRPAALAVLGHPICFMFPSLSIALAGKKVVLD